MTGYDLARQFSSSLDHVWRAAHSQIYPELRRLEGDGLAVAREVVRGDRATKREYSITESGCEELQSWIDQVAPPPPERSAPHLKATYLEYASFETARRQFREHLDHYETLRVGWEKHLQALRDRDTTLMRQRLAKTRPEAHDGVVAYKVHVYEGLIARAEVEIEWARKGFELVDRLEADARMQPGERLTRPTPSTGDDTARDEGNSECSNGDGR